MNIYIFNKFIKKGIGYIAINFTSFLVKEYFLTTGVFGDSLTTDELAATARFPVFGGSPISFGFILGTLLIIAYILFFTKSKRGFEIMLDFARACVARGGNVVFSVVDIIGDGEIAKAKAIADSIGAKLRVRKMIDGQDR